MRFKNLIIIILIIAISALLYKVYDGQNAGASLFSKEIINLNDVERIEILDLKTNSSIEIKDQSVIKEFTTYLNKVNSDKADIDEGSEQPLYYINISNVGHHPYPPVSVFKDSIMYNGVRQQLSAENSSTLFKMIDDAFRDNEKDG